MIIQEFSSLPLHDAVLISVEVVWEKKLCNIYLKAFTVQGQNAHLHRLEFHHVTNLVLPQAEPWGPSLFILAGASIEGGFQVQMQPGDNIEVTANGFAFVAL